MSFSRNQAFRAVGITAVAAALSALPGCRRSLSDAEKADRATLRQALREHAYERATTLAERIVQLHPDENGAWDRLLQAHAGMHDTAGAKATLERWRRAVPQPSAKLDEYTGDFASATGDAAHALQVWTEALNANGKNLRVLGKVAHLQHTQRNWHAENKAWTALLQVKENATARLQRALCGRHLHRWEEAFDDLHRAQSLARQDPDVIRATKLFERLEQFLDGIRDLDARLAVAPNDAATITDRALLFLRAGDSEMALEDSEAGGRLAAWAVRPRLFRGIALVLLGRPEECERLGVRRSLRVETLPIESLETISRLDAEISVERSNAELYLERAWQLDDIGQPRLALEDAENATRLDAQSAGAYAESSYALMKLGRASEAYEQIKRATGIDPSFTTAWQYRGELEMQKADFIQAVESLSRALAITQTAVVLLKREQCYRRLGLLVKAEEDHRMLQDLTSRALR